MISTQAIQIRYNSPTATKGTTITLLDKQFKKSIKLSYDYDVGNVLTQAQKWLEDKGYKTYTHSTLGQDNWIVTVDHKDNFKDITL